MSELKIEKGVAIPEKQTGRHKTGQYKYPFRDMEVGDSFFVPGANHHFLVALGNYPTKNTRGGNLPRGKSITAYEYGVLNNNPAYHRKERENNGIRPYMVGIKHISNTGGTSGKLSAIAL